MMLYYDALEEYKLLTDEQFGKLIRAGLVFARDGTETELEAPEAYLFPGLRMRIARDAEKYQITCEKRAEAARKRWNQQQENEDAEMQTDANGCKRTEYKDKDKSKSEEKEKYDIKSKSKSESESKARSELLQEGYTETEISEVLSRIGSGAEIKNLTAYIKKAIDEQRRAKRIGKRVSAQDYEQRDYSGVDAEIRERMAQEIEQWKNDHPEQFDENGRLII